MICGGCSILVARCYGRPVVNMASKDANLVSPRRAHSQHQVQHQLQLRQLLYRLPLLSPSPIPRALSSLFSADTTYYYLPPPPSSRRAQPCSAAVRSFGTRLPAKASRSRGLRETRECPPNLLFTEASLSTTTTRTAIFPIHQLMPLMCHSPPL